MANPGWYTDHQDDRLVRWFDGVQWTPHTIVKAEWRGPGAPPPPGVPAAPPPQAWQPAPPQAPQVPATPPPVMRPAIPSQQPAQPAPQYQQPGQHQHPGQYQQVARSGGSLNPDAVKGWWRTSSPFQRLGMGGALLVLLSLALPWASVGTIAKQSSVLGITAGLEIIVFVLGIVGAGYLLWTNRSAEATIAVGVLGVVGWFLEFQAVNDVAGHIEEPLSVRVGPGLWIVLAGSLLVVWSGVQSLRTRSS